MSDRTRTLFLLAPAILVIGGLFLASLALGLVRSFGYLPAIGLTDPTLGAYRAVLTDPAFLRSLGLTLWIALASTAIAALIALGAALLLRQTFPGRALALFLFQLNLTIPHIVGAIGILYLFSQSGSFARLAHATHLITTPADFPALVFDPYAIGIILTYVWKEVPFIGLILLARMQTIGADYEAVARSHGATRGQAVRHILLPLLMPSLIGASALTFAFSFGAYEIPALLGASFPKALPVLAYQSFTDVDLTSRPEALAMAIVIALIGAVMLAIVFSHQTRTDDADR
ncbi:MAG: ABC transporter permease subunit [Tabrizicola sp.]|uniref:ABC transporter permease n=1 Tax=Tabrizicola sp. TaxID=2005166 RepID=UPI002736B5E1|nr:ABC transporter permease subunit [Tabrizicola sp.]MDP3263691.1 ABC transporter permease subunit [Tabrizicola sp.]MDP3647055.1 ABC transporter permease subunit [Paracoccaceae bacterium]MDZ4066848.1 ABC transporter permease subunit [Tabrizicola sp.]